MGYMRHHAVLVTGWQREAVQQAHEEAKRLVAEVFGSKVTDGEPSGIVSDLHASAANRYSSFCVFPDGSKEWWPTSDAGDAVRNAFVAWLHAARERDLWLDWCEVQYGDDDGDDRLLRSVAKGESDE